MDAGEFREYLFVLAIDKRLTVWHLAVLFSIMQLATGNVFSETIQISRKKVMRFAKIKSFVTYHKCIMELERFGYLIYIPSYHPGYGSKIHLLKVG